MTVGWDGADFERPATETVVTCSTKGVETQKKMISSRFTDVPRLRAMDGRLLKYWCHKGSFVPPDLCQIGRMRDFVGRIAGAQELVSCRPKQ